MKKSLMKSVILYAFLFILVLLSVAIIRTLTIEKIVPKDVCKDDDADFISVKDGSLAKRFSQALTFQTISWSINNTNIEDIKIFIKFIEKTFPAIHSSSFISREIVNNASLLYTVIGSNTKLKPYMLAGHMDVVPVDMTQWDVPPFEGVIKDGFIYGRGAIDAKHVVMGILEALEAAIKAGYRPKRSFYIAFGHDEEVLGINGAANIAKLLKKRNVTLEYLLDEGLVPTMGCYPGVTVPVVTLGVTEKGYLTINITAKGTTGHSSMPVGDSAIATLAKVLSRFHYKVHPNMFGQGLETEIFPRLAPYTPLLYRFVYSNVWLFSPLMAWLSTLKGSSHALVRTSTAVTVISGGLKDNILPTSAHAIVNHRIHPLQSVEKVLEFDRQLVQDFDNVHIEPVSFREPHPVSPYDSQALGYQIIAKTAKQIFPNSPVIPGVMMANTDTRWYLGFTRAIYRFSPVLLQCDDIKGFHGNNERMPVDSYEKLVNFYYHLIKNSDAEKLGKPLEREEL